VSLSEPNKNIHSRLEGNQRMENVPLSERTGALKGCATFFSSAAVLLGAVLTFFGWMQAGITVAVTFVILSLALHFMARSNESSTRKAKEAEQKWRDDKAGVRLRHAPRG
jgi:hypothetical protein